MNIHKQIRLRYERDLRIAKGGDDVQDAVRHYLGRYWYSLLRTELGARVCANLNQVGAMVFRNNYTSNHCTKVFSQKLFDDKFKALAEEVKLLVITFDKVMFCKCCPDNRDDL